jgi:hypothetical protein
VCGLENVVHEWQCTFHLGRLVIKRANLKLESCLTNVHITIFFFDAVASLESCVRLAH